MLLHLRWEIKQTLNFEKTQQNSGVQKKTRKRMQVYDVGLKEATKDIAQALGAAEESRDHRHKEALECNKELVRIEGRDGHAVCCWNSWLV